MPRTENKFWIIGRNGQAITRWAFLKKEYAREYLNSLEIYEVTREKKKNGRTGKKEI